MIPSIKNLIKKQYERYVQYDASSVSKGYM